jgi:hypothetical protein
MPTQSNSTPQSPNSSTDEDLLAEASPASLEELMNRAPQITDSEADQIISYLRSQREKFAQQEATPKPKKSPRSKGPIISADELLKDIDLNF